MADPQAVHPREIILQGIGVSPGVAVGPAFLLTIAEDRIVERAIAEEEIPRELARFEDALIATRQQLLDIQRQVGQAMGREGAGIFDAHLLVADDRAFVDEAIRGLGVYRRNIEFVISVVVERYAAALERVEDAYLRERVADVRDVARRILHNLAGSSSTRLLQVRHPCVLVANDLPPSEAALLKKEIVTGFVIDLGSHTSHTAIMARALQIPAVVGLRDISVRVSPDDLLLIDGNKGTVVIHPSDATLEQYGKAEAARRTIRTGLAALQKEPAETLDGYHVVLAANIELPTDLPAVAEHGANGVGLFRTEYLYLSRKTLPTEDEQFEAYESVARQCGEAPVIIRTMDLGGDKFLSHLKMPTEMNPFMGWRAIRFCLAQPDIFKTQLRAMLRASRHRNVKIMYPMISNVDEVLRANELLAGCKLELRERGEEFNEDVEVGVMIEIPSAALTAHLLAPRVSFFSIGTNDLVQYTLAVDRVNERIAHLYEPTHPAIVRLIKNTVDVGHQHGIWTGVCGEMAADPVLAPLLIGLGVDEFSMNPGSIPLVKGVIRKLRYSQAERLAAEVLTLDAGARVREACRRLLAEMAPEILELVE